MSIVMNNVIGSQTVVRRSGSRNADEILNNALEILRRISRKGKKFGIKFFDTTKSFYRTNLHERRSGIRLKTRPHKYTLFK